jgi:hypothetical protein
MTRSQHHPFRGRWTALILLLATLLYAAGGLLEPLLHDHASASAGISEREGPAPRPLPDHPACGTCQLAGAPPLPGAAPGAPLLSLRHSPAPVAAAPRLFDASRLPARARDPPVS